MTLDVIGLAGMLLYSTFRNFTIFTISFTGFNYKFNALSTGSEKSELLKAFDTVFRAGTSPTILPMMKAMVPAFRILASFFFFC